jgi:uncharacterized protein (DUF1697 family)
MPAAVALLRGINVGGRAKLPMADLRRMAQTCGFEQVRTYIQSGNMVFVTAETDMGKVAELLQRRIAEETGMHGEVAVRTRDELDRCIADNPFLQSGVDAAHCHVVFLLDGVEKEAGAAFGKLDLPSYAPDEAELAGREVYMHMPNGLGRSKLAADLGRARGLAGTARNWRTVTKLSSMLGELD